MTPSHLPPTPSTSSSINAFIEDTKGIAKFCKYTNRIKENMK